MKNGILIQGLFMWLIACAVGAGEYTETIETDVALPIASTNALDNASAGISEFSDWYGQTNVTHDGEDAMQSGVVDDWGASAMVMTNTITGPARISFWWKVSASDDDKLQFSTNDGGAMVQHSSISGEKDWKLETFFLGEGHFDLIWEYFDESSGNNLGARCGWVDQLEIIESPDADGDQMPDLWEQQHFDSDMAPETMCSNRVNTALEAFIAGLDPTDPASTFTTSILKTSVSSLLEWNSISGRVYSVYSSTNATSGFTPVATNIPWTVDSFLDPDDAGDERVFYKVGVEMAP